MEISNQTVKYLAQLARIELEDKQLSVLAGELEDIIKFIDKLSKVNVDNIEPMSHVHNVKNVFRDDEVKPSLERDLSMKNAPETKQDFFKVSKVIE